MTTKGIYRFYWDCGRMGDVEGVFIATDEDVASIQGKEVYFGEILGKHSEVYGYIDSDDIKLLSEDPVAVGIVEQYRLSSGYNPFDYYEEEIDEDEEVDSDEDADVT